METKLEVQKLSKKFDSFLALDEISFHLFSGEIVILSGPNGSGKTTLLSCLAGLIRPTSGVIRVDDFDFNQHEVEFHRRLAFVPDVPRFYMELTAWEHLRFIAMANKVLEGFEDRAERLLSDFGLWAYRNHFPHHYSRGMQLKLGLAFALIRPFQVLLLDEPTSALDQESIEVLIDYLERLRSNQTSVLLSSHDPAIAERLGDRMFRITQGELAEV
jgi:ABC-2 type transport system ATP-binding protein